MSGRMKDITMIKSFLKIVFQQKDAVAATAFLTPEVSVEIEGQGKKVMGAVHFCEERIKEVSKVDFVTILPEVLALSEAPEKLVYLGRVVLSSGMDVVLITLVCTLCRQQGVLKISEVSLSERGQEQQKVFALTQGNTQKDMECVVMSAFDHVVMVDVAQNSYVFYSRKEGTAKLLLHQGKNYTEDRAKFLGKFVVQEDKARCLRALEIETMVSRLQDKPEFDFVFSVQDRSGTIRKKKIGGFYSDTQAGQICITKSDITEFYEEQQKKNEQLQHALVLAERANESKTEFLSRMSHEIRTPMNAILGMTHLAKDLTNQPAQLLDCLGKLESSEKYLQALIRDILDMSKIENGSLQLSKAPFLLSESLHTVEELASCQAKEKGVWLQMKCLGLMEQTLEGDALRLQQVLMTLLSNAIKFTPRGGTVGFSTTITGGDAKQLELEFQIWDTGVGMSAGFLPHIFESFAREDNGSASTYHGTGLGLPICRNIVHLMGGRIHVNSQKGTGSEFLIQVSLPIYQGGTLPKLEGKPTWESLEGKHVLLAEDHPLNIEVAQKLLAKKGVIVDVAENGRLVVDAFAKKPAGYYDAVLMDIRMPIVDGLCASQIIRNLPKKDSRTIPIIAMTGNAFEEDQKKSRAAGMNAHLSKPIEPQTLYDTLALYIR